MDDTHLIDSIEMIIVAGVAMTNAALSRAPAGHELTFPQWRVLVILADADGLPVNEISRLIEVTLPATGRQLRRLEQRGLVHLDPDQRDRRVTRARLTEAGRATRASITEQRRALIQEAVSDLGIDAAARRALVRIASAMAGEDPNAAISERRESPQRRTGLR